MTLQDLIFTGLIMLISDEGSFWEFYETDPDWWQLYLWTKRN